MYPLGNKTQIMGYPPPQRGWWIDGCRQASMPYALGPMFLGCLRTSSRSEPMSIWSHGLVADSTIASDALFSSSPSIALLGPQLEQSLR